MARNKLTFGGIIDVDNSNWHPSTEYLETFVRAQQSYLNDRLRDGSFLTVNEVFESLGFDKSVSGMVFGWDQDDRIEFDLDWSADGSLRVSFNAFNIYDEMQGKPKDQIQLETRRDLDLNKDLAEAIELLDAGLILRMHGDISHMPMTQAEWDSKTEAFLRRLNEEND